MVSVILQKIVFILAPRLRPAPKLMLGCHRFGGEGLKKPSVPGDIARPPNRTVEPMKQMSFSGAEYAGKRKQTRREHFLIEMDRVGPWKGLIALIESHYPRGEGGGRPAYP